jgi:hypothetical protein
MDINEVLCEVVDWIHLAHYGPVACSFEQLNETLGSGRRGEFHDQLGDCQLLKKP